jgi:YD repeat-containing protein
LQEYAGKSFHGYTNLTLPAATASRKWTFEETAGPYLGLVKQLDVGTNGAAHPMSRNKYTWSQDGKGRPYLSADVSEMDPGTAYFKVSKTTQTLDIYGNLTQRQVYDYAMSEGALTVARTYTTNYLTGADYESRYIRTRLLNAMVTPAGGAGVWLASKAYDQFSLTNRTGRQHDSANYPAAMTKRGNETGTWGYGQEIGVNTAFDITGMAVVAWQGSKQVSTTPAQNNAAPGTMTVNNNGNYQHNLSWNSFLGLTQDAGPNGATASYSYDQYARPSQTNSPHGAVTTYEYNDAQRWVKATTGTRWVKTYVDGFGRTVKVETGTGGTIISTVDTEYDACACTPMGKVKRVSQPYPPGGTVKWTTYTYDNLGRTVSVALPDSMGTTGYVYEGNTVKTTDPAGKWKKFTMNVLGELVQVNEPNPAGGADYVTTYGYSAMGKLLTVSMPRPNGGGSYNQTRTFNYDTNGMLTSTVNPETGTVTYTYDSSLLKTEIDAKNQKTEYVYDATYRRVTEIKAVHVERQRTRGGYLPEDEVLL